MENSRSAGVQIFCRKLLWFGKSPNFKKWFYLHRSLIGRYVAGLFLYINLFCSELWALVFDIVIKIWLLTTYFQTKISTRTSRTNIMKTCIIFLH